MKATTTSISMVLFLVGARAFASGGVHCRGDEVQVSWGTSHMTGNPKYGNPLTIEVAEKKETINDKQIVGYYAHSNIILLLSLDEEMDGTLLDLRFNSETLKPSYLVYKGKRFTLKECLFE